MSLNRNFFIMCIVVLMIMYIPVRINKTLISKVNNMKVAYDEVMANATSDASKELIYSVDSFSLEQQGENKKVDYRDLNLNLDRALKRFYDTLYINLNIEDSYSHQEGIKYRLPIKLVTGYDGYYMSFFKMDGKSEEWSEKKPYSFVDKGSNLVVHFTLDDYVYINDINNNKKFEGRQKEFQSKYPNSCLKDKNTFENVKNQVINSNIQEDLKYYTYYSNSIAKSNGWQINYDVPYWGNRSVDSVAFMSFYQGEVLDGSEKSYNSFGFGSTKIVERKAVYGYKKDGRNVYSNYKDGSDIIYFSNEFEAAKSGYEPDFKYYKK